MRADCLYCGGELIPVLGVAHWKVCAAKCAGSSKLEPALPDDLVVIRRPTLIDQGRPGWPHT